MGEENFNRASENKFSFSYPKDTKRRVTIFVVENRRQFKSYFVWVFAKMFILEIVLLVLSSKL